MKIKKNPFLEFFAEIGIMVMYKKHPSMGITILDEFRKGRFDYQFVNGTKCSARKGMK